MSQLVKRNRNRSRINKTEVLINEMQKRKKACLIKLQKISDRINILEDFKNMKPEDIEKMKSEASSIMEQMKQSPISNVLNEIASSKSFASTGSMVKVVA